MLDEPVRCRRRGRSAPRRSGGPRSPARRAAGDPSALVNASASAAGSPGGTTRPLPAARTVAPRAETSEATSGRRQAIASRATLGSPSRSPLLSTTDGTRRRRPRRTRSGSSSCDLRPTSSTMSPSPWRSMDSSSNACPTPCRRSGAPRGPAAGRPRPATSGSPSSRRTGPPPGSGAGHRPPGGAVGPNRAEVDPVREEGHPRAGHGDVLRDVGVAGHDARGRPGASGQLVGRDLPGVQRVHAEAEAHAERASGVGGDLGGLVGEVPVDAVDARRCPGRRRAPVACCAAPPGGSIRTQGEQLLGARLRCVPVARLGRVDADQHARPCEGDELPEGERLRRAGEPAHDDREARRHAETALHRTPSLHPRQLRGESLRRAARRATSRGRAGRGTRPPRSGGRPRAGSDDGRARAGCRRAARGWR